MAASDAGEERVPAAQARPIAFAHMLLKVADTERSRRFYVDLLGFTIRAAKPLADGRPFVPFHEGLALTSGGPRRADGPDGEREPMQIDHMAFKAAGVRAIAARLQAAHVKFFRELHDGLYGLTIYVADPDGNMIELYEEGATMG